jgi:hypothetical protein
VTADLLGTERPVRRSVRPLLALALVLGGSGFVADDVLRRHEVSALGSCVEAAEGDLVDLTRRVTGVETYVGPQLTSASVSASVRASLAGLVQQAVARDLPRSMQDRQRCARLHVLAWHGGTQRGRTSFVSYLDARLEQLRAATSDLTALHTAPGEVTVRRGRAVIALREVGVTLSP